MTQESDLRGNGESRIVSAAARPFARSFCTVPRRTRWIIYVLVALCAIAARAWDQRRYWTRNNFRKVSAGKIYAGGFQYRVALTGSIWKHRIRTVLTLLPQGPQDDLREQETVRARGAAFRRVVVPFMTPTGERFSSREEFTAAQLAAVEEAVSIIADPKNQPVFVHCRGGNHRTGAVVAVYRVQQCGWTEEEARAELLRYGGSLGNTTWPSKVLHTFCESHIGGGDVKPPQAGTQPAGTFAGQ